MDLHKGIHFEAEICQQLTAQGWLVVEPRGEDGDAAKYDRARALISAAVTGQIDVRGWRSSA